MTLQEYAQKLTPRESTKPARDVCPKCGHTLSYKGFTSVECDVVASCSNYRAPTPKPTITYERLRFWDGGPQAPAQGTRAWAKLCHSKGLSMGWRWRDEPLMPTPCYADPNHQSFDAFADLDIDWELLT